MEKIQEAFTGTIVFLPDDIGSKSEAVYPFLYVCRETCFRVMMKGDNPFENNGFVPHDGKLVEVLGSECRGIFIVESVRAVGPEGKVESKENFTK